MQKLAYLFLFILACSFVAAQEKSPLPVERAGKWGVPAQDHYKGVPFIYDRLYRCPVAGQYIARKNDKWGSVDANHKIIIPVQYDTKDEDGGTFQMDGEAYFGLDDAFLLGKKGKWGLLDYTGKTIMPFQYTDLQEMGDVYVAQKNGKYGIINKNGRVHTPFQYKNFLGMWRQDMAVLSKDGEKWLFVDVEGKESGDITATLTPVDSINKDHVMVFTLAGKQGVLNTRGEIIIPCLYDDLYTGFSQSIIRYRKDGNYGIIDFAGKEITPPIYTEIKDYPSESSISVQKNKQWGLIDLAGKEIIPCLYDAIEPFSDSQNITKVTKNEKLAIIDKQNKLVTDFIYQEIYMYHTQTGELKGVMRNDKWGYIDDTGKEVIPCQFESTIGFFGATLIPVKKDGKYGYINNKGEAIIPFKYDKASEFYKNSTARVELNGKVGKVDKQGKETW